MSEPPPLNAMVLVPVPFGASTRALTVSVGPAVSVILKLVSSSFAAASRRAAAAAGSAAAALPDGAAEEGVADGDASLVQPATPNVTAASRPSPVPARRRSSMGPPGVGRPPGPDAGPQCARNG